MRKYIVTLLLVLAIVGFAGIAAARAETIYNSAYAKLVESGHACGKCIDKCHSCGHKCEPCCEPKCEPCCKPKCEPCCEPKCEPCCPQLPCTYPDPCRGSTEPFSRDGLSRRKAK
jgi:hypothetical protein